jgi:hypothetical protein
MRTFISTFVGLALLAGIANPVTADAQERPGFYKKKKQKHHRYVRPGNGQRGNGSEYYEHLADKLPIGSSRWFEQMDREGRFGQRQN